MNEIKEMLNEEIKKSIQNLSEFEDGSEEKAKAVDDLVKLHKLTTEEAKIEAEIEETRKSRIDSKLTTWVNVGVSLFTFITGTCVTVGMYKKGLKFEETGTVTSSHTRQILPKIFNFGKK